MLLNVFQGNASSEEFFAAARQIAGLVVLLFVMQRCFVYCAKFDIAHFAVHRKEVTNLLVLLFKLFVTLFPINYINRLKFFNLSRVMICWASQIAFNAAAVWLIVMFLLLYILWCTFNDDNIRRSIRTIWDNFQFIVFKVIIAVIWTQKNFLALFY